MASDTNPEKNEPTNAPNEGASGAEATPKAAPKPAPPRPTKPKPTKVAGGEGDLPQSASRRKFTQLLTFGGLGLSLLAFMRFFFPRTLFEPSSRFKIGLPSDYGFGVDTKFQSSQRIWVVRDATKLFVINAICTHLGCTPDWKPTDNKFKCPCHGSGFDSEGVNFEGPAPIPLRRLAVSLDTDGQIVVDKSTEFERGDGGWKDPRAFIPA